MELGKYKKAMRPKKYLTHEFLVYRPSTPEARSEMQAGGVVQREGFFRGTNPPPEGSEEFLKIFLKKTGVSSWEKLSPQQRNVFTNTFPKYQEQQSKIKSKITSDELAKKLGITKQQLKNYRANAKRATTPGVTVVHNKIVELLGEPDEYRQMIGSKKGGSQLDRVYYNTPTDSDIEIIKSFLPDAKKSNILQYQILNRMKNLTAGKKGDKFLKILETENLSDPDIFKKINKLFPNYTPNEISTAVTRIAQVADGQQFRGVDFIKTNPKLAKKLFKQMQEAPFGNPFATASYKIALSELDKKLKGKDTLNFKTYRKYINDEMKKIGLDPEKFNVDEYFGVSVGGLKEEFAPYSVFSRAMEADLNQKQLAQFQGTLSRYINMIDDQPNKKARFKEIDRINKLIDAKEKDLGVELPRFFKGSAEKAFGKKRYKELTDQGLDFTTSRDYSIKIPKGALTQKEILSSLKSGEGKSNTINQITKDIRAKFKNNPQLFQIAEASYGKICRVKKSTGGKISGESYDACIARNLSETIGDAGSADDAKRGKAMGKLMQMTRSAKTVGKGALRGLQSILIGTGPVEIPIALGLEVAGPLYNYFQGEKLETILGSAPLLGYALSKINPEKFSEEAIQKAIYSSGLNEEEIKQAENLVAQLKRYVAMKDLFEQKESTYDYYQQLIDEGADPTSTTNMRDKKIAELDKLINKNAEEFGAEENKVTADQIRIMGKGISNAAEEAQFQKEKTFLHKYFYNPAADPMTPRDYIDRKKMSYMDRIFYGDDLGMSRGIRPELRTIQTPEIEDYYGGSMVPTGIETAPVAPTPFAEGGVVERKGFANGPKIGRRGFLGLLAGVVASLKVGSFGGTGKKVTTEVAKKVIKDAPTGTPEWFAPLVDKVFKEGVDASQTMKTTEREIVKKLEVPSPGSEGALTDKYYLYQNTDTGEIRIDIDAPGAGVNGEEFSLYMRPDRVEGITDDGLPMIDNGEFVVLEQRAAGRMDGPDDYVMELDQAVVGLDDSASNWHAVEEFATGKTNKKAEAEQLKKKDYIEKNPAEDIESRYGPFDDTPPDDD